MPELKDSTCSQDLSNEVHFDLKSRRYSNTPTRTRASNVSLSKLCHGRIFLSACFKFKVDPILLGSRRTNRNCMKSDEEFPLLSPAFGMGFVISTDISNNTKALAVSQHTVISNNTKALAVSQHTDISNNTKAWAVSQHADTSMNTKAALKCCCPLHSYVETLQP